MERKVLITGIAGFLGRYCAREFLRSDWRVAGLDVVPAENAGFGQALTYHQVALPSAKLKDVISQENPDVCVHCAGRASVPLSMEDPATDFRDNTVLTFDLLDALRLHASRCRLIFLSSAAVYGNPESLPVSETHLVAPVSPYGFHKRQGEWLCEEFSRVYGVPTLSVRIFSAYGPGLRRQVVWDICQKALGKDGVRLRGTGRETRDFIHAADVARALVMLAAKAPAEGEIYNVATGRETPVAELCQIVLAALGNASKPSFDGQNPSGNPLRWLADISKLKTLGFAPAFSLEEGVRQVATWCAAEWGGTP